MMTELLVIAVVLGALGLTVWRWRVPWPQHLRWILAAAATDPTAAAYVGVLGMREVRVIEIARSPERSLVSVSGANGTPEVFELHGDVTIAARAHLERWEAAQTPLLLMSVCDGETGLYGPRHSVTGLRRAPGADLAKRETRTAAAR